ncbi:Transmembrane and coiled-coil domains protein 2 [Plecturocebus cupreus]
MKRCKSDELQQQQGEEDGAGLEDAASHLPGGDLRPGETTGANSAGGPTSDAGAAAAPNPGPRSKPPDLKWWLTAVNPALWEAEAGRSQGQEFETRLTNVVKPRLY